MSQEALMNFQQIVFDDAELQKKLREINDQNDFIEKVLKISKEYNLEVTAEDVSDAFQVARRIWIERWLG